MAQPGHRSSWMKQKNKSHKSTFRSSRELNRLQGGKIRGKSVSSSASSGSGLAHGKRARMQQSIMQRKNKREALVASRRAGGTGAGLSLVGGEDAIIDGAPKNCVVIGLSEDANTFEVAQSLAVASGLRPDAVNVQTIQNIPTTVLFPAEKTRLSVLVCARNTLSILDACKAADIVVFVLKVGKPATQNPFGKGVKTESYGKSAFSNLDDYLKESVDESGRQFMSLVKAQGKPAVVGIVQGLDLVANEHCENPIPIKHHNPLKKHATTFFNDEFGEEAKVVAMTAINNDFVKQMDAPDQQAMVSAEKKRLWPLLRALNDVRLRRITWRAERSYLLATHAAYDASKTITEDDGTETSTLLVSGFLRGRPMNIHQLVHIPGEGSFQVDQVDVPNDPYALNSHKKKARAAEVSLRPDEARMQDLKEEADPDIMAGDQTWPTPEELAQAQGMDQDGIAEDETLQEMLKRKKKGMKEADPHSIWLQAISEDENSDDEDGEGANVDLDYNQEDEEGAAEKAAYDEYKRKRAMEQEDVEFPDEMDTPHEVPARLRFQKFRGMKSFRTSPWHPKESLPRQYARIFQFKHFHLIQQQALKDAAELENKWINASSVAVGNTRKTPTAAKKGMDTEMDGENDDEQGLSKDILTPGLFVRLHIRKVPTSLLPRLEAERLPLFVGALLEHEQKLSVIHCNVQRTANYEEPIVSREPLILHCGMWRRVVCPTFSENNINCDKHKFERFLQPGRWTVASAYSPITFGSNVPVLLFKAKENGVVLDRGALKKKLNIPGTVNDDATIVATGSLMGADPDRIILKKIILSGHPVRVKKRWAVVRYMFFTPEDIKWFRPVEIWTKYGASGRILESVGTHGSMKCQFDNPIKNHDSVCMSLYKRVFPRPVHEFRDLVAEEME